MSDKYQVPPGGEFDLTLRRKPKEKPARPAPQDRPGLIAPDDDESRYVFRGRPQIIFLDLATRLRSVPASDWTGDRVRPPSDSSSPAARDDYFDEYVEIIYERAAPVKLAPPALAEVSALDARLLGSRAPGSSDTLDPLGQTPANVTLRKLYNCMPLVWDSFWLYVTAQVNDKLYKLKGDFPDAEVTPPEWKRRKAASKDSLERWNARNLSADVPFGSGVLKVKGAVKSLRVTTGDYSAEGLPRAVGAYEEFDTDDTSNFKITTEARSDAAGVSLKLAVSTVVRVYLKPRLWRNELATSDPTAPFRWDGRVPVYPDLYFFRNAATEEDLKSRAMCYVRRSPLASGYYDSHPPAGSATLVWPTFTSANVPPVLTPAGALCCVIAQGAKVYYVWRTQARALDFAHDLNPYVGGVTLDTPCS